MKTYIVSINNLLKLFSLFIVLLAIPLQAQQEHTPWEGKQAHNWAFGKFAGLTFETGDAVPIVTSANTLEGSAAISSAEGELICYGAANIIYDKDDNVMQNGNGIQGFSISSTQAGIIVPKPGNPDIYYAFGTPAIYDTPGNFTYSEIDMSLNGGNGAITENKNIVLYENMVSEKITAVYHQNRTDIWVIVHAMGSNEFLAYLVTENGITTTPVVSAVGIVYSDVVAYDYGSGQIKASPDGTKLAAVIPGVFVGIDKGVEIYDFDDSTGIISNPMFIEAVSGVVYTLEFSPNSQYVYVVDAMFAWLLFISPVIRQYDVTAGDLEAVEGSMQVVADLTGSLFTLSNMQAAPDGRIYVSNMVGTSTLNVIRNPNNQGIAAGFQANTVYLGDGAQTIGLPTFIQTYFESGLLAEGRCPNQPVTFETVRIPDITSITWDFGDPDSGEANISNSPVHFYSNPGTYTVTAEITSNNGTQTASMVIEIIEGPDASVPAEDLRTQCAGLDGTALFDLVALETAIRNGQDAEDYQVAFYASETELNSGISIVNETEFVTSGQTIYAVVSGGPNECIATVAFDLIVNPLPVLTALPEIESCGNLAGNATFNLRQFDAQLVQGQDVTLFEIAYFTDAETTSLITQPENFVSSTITVYARVTSIVTGCVSLMPLNLVVGPVGVLELETILGCSPFDLTMAAAQVPEGYTVSYYQDEAGALAGNAIDSPEAYRMDDNTGTVYIVAHDTNGCFSAGPLSLEADGCVIPRGISPNGDGMNDNFDLSAFDVNSLLIFNRYGMEVFSYANYSDQWHGQDTSGNDLPTATYFYVVYLAGGEEITGWVYINREIN